MPDSVLTSSGAAEGHHEAYQIEERIAVGPAGIVYRALQSGTHREVTFKLLNPAATHPLDPARVSAIKPSVDVVREHWIAEWIDAYQDADGYVLVFDYKKGIAGNLFPNEKRQLSMADGLRLAAQFCEVLHAAEQAALPHGDIKPSNVIIWNDPAQGLSLQMLDWGLSICRTRHPEESLHCMSPERLRGGAPTLAGDIFSIGVTLTFLLTGYFPVQGGSPEEIITGWQNFNPASIALVRPDLDEHFCQWLVWLMSCETKDRPASSSDAIDALNQAVAAATMAQSASLVAGNPTVVRKNTKRTKPRPPPPHAKFASSTRLLSTGVTTQPRPSRSWRVIKGFLETCILLALVAAACIWAQKKYGLQWNDLLAARWHGSSLSAVKSEPVIVETKPVAPATPPSNKAPPALAMPAAPPAKPAVIIQMRDPLTYPKDTKLDGANGGTGWPGSWRANNGISSIPPTRRRHGMAIGGATVSVARREIAVFPAVESSGICLVCSILHSGAEGPVLSLDVLSPANGSGPAPVLLVPKGNNLIVSIPKSTQTVEIESKPILRLAAQWNFKKQTEGKYECTMTVYLNPVFGNGGRTAPLPTLSCVTTDFTPPDKLELALASIGVSQRNAIISDIRIARTLAEALK